ncbi:MAG TPA: type II secretion system protein [Candidatus Paceibacterota bacterium]
MNKLVARSLQLVARKVCSAFSLRATGYKLPADRGFTPYHFCNDNNKSDKGFTLVELLVSVTLFAIVMLVSVGTLLSLVGANRKAQALQSVMNNLNVSLDGMVRSIRMGSNYSCGDLLFEGTGNNDDCTLSGSLSFSFEPFNLGIEPVKRWRYEFESGSGRIKRSRDEANWEYITAPEVKIDKMTFYVEGTNRGDNKQPKVVITLRGTANASDVKAKTTFSIQATAVQRILDL